MLAGNAGNERRRYRAVALWCATSRDVYRRNAVFSSQLAFYEYLLTHQWRKCASPYPAYDVMGGGVVLFG